MKLSTQAPILLLIIFILTPFLSFTSHKYSALPFPNCIYGKSLDLFFANYMNSECKLPLQLERYERERLERWEAQALSWQKSLLRIGGLIMVGIGASVLARIAGEVIVGEGITKKNILGAVERVAVGAKFGGAIVGSATVIFTVVPAASNAVSEGNGMAEAAFAAKTIVKGAVLGGIVGTSMGAWGGVLVEPLMALEDRERFAQEIEDAKL